MPQNDKSNKQSDDYDPAYDPAVADADLTAEQYLRRQGERAKAAMMGAAGVIKQTAIAKVKGNARAANDAPGSLSGDGSSGPMKVVKEHPWYAVGAATTAGFLGALYFNPSRFGRLKAKIKKLEKRLNEQEGKLDASPKQSNGDSKAQTAAKSSIVSSLGTLVVTQAMNALKPLLSQYIAPLMAGRGQPEYAPEDAYGQYQPQPQAASPAAQSAAEERFGGNPPPRSAGDPSI